MNDVVKCSLTDIEIQNVLKIIQEVNDKSEDLNERNIRPYKFSMPSKFSNEQFKALEIIFNAYADLLSSFLTTNFKTNCDVKFVNLKEQTYGDFAATLINPVLISFVNLNPLKNFVFIELESNIAFVIIDKILGGSGKPINKMRDFSDLEKSLLERLISQMSTLLVEPWSKVITLKPQLEKLETNAKFIQVLSEDEAVVCIVLDVKISGSEGQINFCLPYSVIEPVSDKLNNEFCHKDKLFPEIDVSKNGIKLKQDRLPISIVIGQGKILCADFLSLSIGDVITLDSYYSSNVNIFIGNLFKFTGRSGVRNGQNSVQITSCNGKKL